MVKRVINKVCLCTSLTAFRVFVEDGLGGPKHVGGIILPQITRANSWNNSGIINQLNGVCTALNLYESSLHPLHLRSIIILCSLRLDAPRCLFTAGFVTFFIQPPRSRPP